MNDTFMKEKPVLPLILSMSLPMVVIHAGQFPLQHCRQLFCRTDQRGSDDGVITGLPGSKFYQCCRNWIWCWNQRSDRFPFGAGDHEKTDQAATQGLVLAVIHGVVMTVCCSPSCRFSCGCSLHPKRSLNLASAILSLRFAFTLIVTVSMAFEKLFQAVGNMKTTMIRPDVRVHHKHRLRPRSDFCYGPSRKWEWKALRWQPASVQTLTLAIYLVVYLARPIRVHIRRQYILPSKKMVIKLYSIGIPATLNLALPSLLISALNAILAAYSEVYILVWGSIQIADLHLSSGEWHCAGDAPPDRL